jgi:tRNA pseudouridine55 synthase
VDGRRSYKTARRAARDPQLVTARPALPAPVSVTTHSVEVVGLESGVVVLRVVSSAGFYVRSLAHDLGQRLGTGAHLSTLRRTRSGGALIEDAVPLATVERNREAALQALVPLAHMLPELTSIVLTEEGVRYATHGRDLGPAVVLKGLAAPPFRSTVFRLLDTRGELVGIGEPAGATGFLHPRVVLV